MNRNVYLDEDVEIDDVEDDKIYDDEDDKIDDINDEEFKVSSSPGNNNITMLNTCGAPPLDGQSIDIEMSMKILIKTSQDSIEVIEI